MDVIAALLVMGIFYILGKGLLVVLTEGFGLEGVSAIYVMLAIFIIGLILMS